MPARELKEGDLVLIASRIEDHVILAQFRCFSKHTEGNTKYFFSERRPKHLYRSDYSSLMPPQVGGGGHFARETESGQQLSTNAGSLSRTEKDSTIISGWRYPLNNRDKIYVGRDEILEFLENTPGFELYASLLSFQWFQHYELMKKLVKATEGDSIQENRLGEDPPEL